MEAGKKSAEKRKRLYGTAQPTQKLSNGAPSRSKTFPNGPNDSISDSSSISVSFKKKNTIVGIRAEYPQAFESIWVKYKRGDKRAALEEWNKLNLSELEIAMLSRSVDRYVQNTPELKFRMHLSRFLKTDWREVEPVLEAGNAEKPKWLQRVSSIESDSWDEGDASHG